MFYCQPMQPPMPGPGGMMNAPGQMNQPYPGQMSPMAQQPPVVSVMCSFPICLILPTFSWRLQIGWSTFEPLRSNGVAFLGKALHSHSAFPYYEEIWREYNFYSSPGKLLSPPFGWIQVLIFYSTLLQRKNAIVSSQLCKTHTLEMYEIKL